MDFYEIAGKMALGSRLRRLADSFTSESLKAYQYYGVDIEPKFFPVFYMLNHRKESSISEIARDIGHSHPSVSKIVKEMTKQGLTVTAKGKGDSRVNVVKLSEKGLALWPMLNEQCTDVQETVEQLIKEASVDLWRAIEQVELLLKDKAFFNRVRQVRSIREQQYVEIIAYSDEYQSTYAELNKTWIKKHWQLEAADINALDHPKEYILDKGGLIFLAKYQNEVVGSCAMLKMDNQCYELAKMAVSEQAKGKGIGVLLGKKIIEKARELNASKVYLESNTMLVPAINLYKKLGFKQVNGINSPYERCNIQMELQL